MIAGVRMGTSASATRHAPTPWQRYLRWITSTRKRRVLAILAMVWIINGFDLALTVIAQRDGVLYEGNPIARQVLNYGEGAVMLFKLTLVAGASSVLFWFRSHRCAELAALLVALTYCLVAFQWKLCYEMYDLTHARHSAQEVEELASARSWPPALPSF